MGQRKLGRISFLLLVVSLDLGASSASGAPKHRTDGTPTLQGSALSEQGYTPVRARKLVNAKVLWMSPDYYLPGQEPQVLDSHAYAIPGEGDPPEAFGPEEKIYYADLYGGPGIGKNRGSGRAASAGDFQNKGIGQTTLVDPDGPETHINGAVSIKEGMREAFWGEINGELPYGGNRVIAVIDRGYDVVFHDGKRRRSVLVIREDPLRPAHYMPLVWKKGYESQQDMDRVQANLERLPDALPKGDDGDLADRGQRLSSGLKAYAARLGEQHAAAYVRRLYHGSITPSNIELSGRFLDYETETALPGYGRAKVLPRSTPFGENRKLKKVLIRDLVSWIAPDLPADLAKAVPSEESLNAEFDRAYGRTLQDEFLLLTGMPRKLVLELRETPAARELARLLKELAGTGARQFLAKHGAPEKVTSFDVNRLLTRLSRVDPRSRKDVRAIIDDVIRSKEHRPLGKLLASAYEAFVGQAETRATRDGVSPRALRRLMKEGARLRNKLRDTAFRWRMLEDFEAVVEKYERLGDPELIRRAIDDRVRSARRDYSRLEPEELSPYSIAIRDYPDGTLRVFDARTGRYSRIPRRVNDEVRDCMLRQAGQF